MRVLCLLQGGRCDELGILLSLKSTKRHSPNSGWKAESHVYPWFHCSSQTVLLELRRTERCKLRYGSFCKQFLGLQRKCSRWRIGFTDTSGVTGRGSNMCVALYQFSLQGQVVLFPWHFFTTLAFAELTGMLIEVCECGIGKSITSTLHDTIPLLHAVGSVCKGSPVVLGSQQAKPGCDPCLHLVWSYARQIVWQGCEFCLLWLCESLQGKAKWSFSLIILTL